MKKLLLFIICILLALSMSACKNDDLQQNNASSNVDTESNVVNEQSDTNSPVININTGEYFVESGRRMVDIKEVSKKEFTEKYAFVLPEDFETANFYFEIPTEDGLEYYNEVENGYIRYSTPDGKGTLHLFICDKKYVGYGCILDTHEQLKKTNINNTDVIVCKNSAGKYRGEFQKNGYYYTFQIYGIDQDAILSALEDLTE